MAGRGPRTRSRQTPDDTRRARDEGAWYASTTWRDARAARGFVADHHGTVITSHEAVDGLARLVLQRPRRPHLRGDRRRRHPLPDADLALVRTEGLALDPLPVTVRDRAETGTCVRIAAGGWREARVLGSSAVTYMATDCFHLLGDALELAIGTAGADALRLGGGAAGGPVLDISTGAVLGVLGTALHTAHRAAGFAVPLRGVAGVRRLPGPVAAFRPGPRRGGGPVHPRRGHHARSGPSRRVARTGGGGAASGGRRTRGRIRGPAHRTRARRPCGALPTGHRPAGRRPRRRCERRSRPSWRHRTAAPPAHCGASLDLLLAHERDPVVLDTLLRAAADGAARRGEEPTRELVHRAGLLLVCTPA